MSYSSPLSTSELIVDDGNYLQHVGEGISLGYGRGYEARNFERFPSGSLYYAGRPDFDLIPDSQWEDRVREQDDNEACPDIICEAAGLPSKDQDGTNYCWFFSGVGALESLRCCAGMPYIELSAASGAARIKDGRNEGGWIGEAAEWLTTTGASETKYWPECSRDVRRYNTAEAQANASLNRYAQWVDLPQSNAFAWVFTSLLLGRRVVVGLNWWGHAIYYVRALWLSGKPAIRARNSWGGSYGENGYFTLTQSRATPDEALAVSSVSMR